MKGLLVNNGERRGIDIRAVYALVATLLIVGSVSVALVAERVKVNQHVTKGEVVVKEWHEHSLNADGWRHLTPTEYTAIIERRYYLREINTRLSRIEEHFGIAPLKPVGSIGPDLMPPGEDD